MKIVVFSLSTFLSGTLDYDVRAYDNASGDELWRARLPAGGQATPLTYSGRDGTQYLLVVLIATAHRTSRISGWHPSA